MIIKIDNSNMDAYKEFFTKAYDLLDKDNLIAEADKEPAGRFTSLEAYFKYIEQLVQKDPNYYIKLPLNEPVLKVDADSRDITIPSNFVKCASVQNDQVAETVIFTIDRFYDYMDLMNAETWVQWTAPGEDGNPREGATSIVLRDISVEENKIRFGWPLDTEITKIPGKVQFSVAFFVRDESTGKIVYRLNSKPASFTIQPALQPELNDEATINRPNSLLAVAVRNNKYPGQGVKYVQDPSFEAPGMHPPASATLENDALTIMAQAVVGDMGHIDYKWLYLPANGTKTLNCSGGNYECKLGDTITATDYGFLTAASQGCFTENAEHLYECTSVTDTDKNIAVVNYEAFGSIGVAYQKTSAAQRVLSDDYYSADASLKNTEGKYEDVYYSHVVDNITDAFVIYSGSLENAENELYEKYTTFTVPAAPARVTGTYQVVATNTIAPNTSKEVRSQVCRLISPSDVVISKDLPLLAVMKAPNKDSDPEVKLSVAVAKAANDDSVFGYIWEGKTAAAGAFVNTAESDDFNNTTAGAVSTIKTPGWYRVLITSDLNRETKSDYSEECKVTFMPTAPVVDYDKTKTTGTYTDEGAHVADVVLGSEVTLSVTAHVVDAGEASTYGKDNLYSEGLDYTWYVSKPEVGIAPLTPNDIIDGDIKSATIKVKNVGQSALDAYVYTCEVTNILNNEKAKSDIAFTVY